MISPVSWVQSMPLPSSSSIVAMLTIVDNQRSDDCYLLSADQATLQLPRPSFTLVHSWCLPPTLQTNTRWDCCLLQYSLHWSLPTLRCIFATSLCSILLVHLFRLRYDTFIFISIEDISWTYFQCNILTKKSYVLNLVFLIFFIGSHSLW